MEFSLSLLATAFLATTAIAAPSKTTRLAERVARRDALRQGQPMIRIPGPEVQGELLEPNKTMVQYSSNWAGAVYEAPPSGATFTAVSATFTVPKPTSTGGSRGGSASAWVGIDGDTYGNSILQTGVDFTVSSSGAVSYDGWYEWYPDYAYDFSGITFSAGQSVALSVVSSSSTSGTATITNLSTGKTVTKTLSSSARLGGQNAEWIVEDYESGGALVPLANWGTVTFTGATAKTNKGSETASGATLIDIEQNNEVLTSASVSGSTVKVSYIG